MPADRWTAVLLALRVLVLCTVLVGVPAFRSSAADRYVQIAHTDGIPYRDFEVEYPPLEALFGVAVGVGGGAAARGGLALLAFASDMTAFLTLRARWGASTARRYLWLGSPLLLFIYRRIDLASVALATLGIVLADRRRERMGGVLFAAAVLTRVWPAVVAPVLWLHGRRRALVAGAVSLGLGIGAWTAVGGLGGPKQVLGFRGARGWEIESTIGVIIWTFTGERRFESGAFRAGAIGAPVRTGLALLVCLTLVAVWLVAARRPLADPAGAPALAAVAALLLFSPVLSPPYVVWLLPWTAVAGDTGRRWLIAGGIPIALTGVVVAVWYLDIWRGHPGLTQTLLFARNLSLVVPVALWLGDRSRPRRNSLDRARET